AGQTDEVEIGATYAVADQILYLLFDERCEAGEVMAAGFDRRLVERLRTAVMRSQFKRRPPLIAQISTRTVGVVFLSPRAWGTCPRRAAGFSSSPRRSGTSGTSRPGPWKR